MTEIRTRSRPGRWKRAVAGAVAAILVILPPTAGAGEPLGDQPGTDRFMLDNGLEVVVVDTGPDAQSQDGVQAWLVVRAGAMTQRDDELGAAMLIERTLLLGTRGHSESDIAAILAQRELGMGQRGASFVSFDQAAYMARAKAGDGAALGKAFGLFAEMLDPQARVIDAERVAQARQQLNARMDKMTMPELRARQHWLPALMGDTIFGRVGVMPEPTDLDALTPERIRRFTDRLYRPEHALVMVVGDVDAHAVKAAAEASLGKPGATRAPGAVTDARLGTDIAGRAVMGAHPDLERQQSALIWFRDRGDEALLPWSRRAAEHTRDDMRRLVGDRVAAEIVRHRLQRLGVAKMGREAKIVADEINLFGQIDVLQIAIALPVADEHAWKDAMTFLTRQCDRLVRDGATPEEIARARRSLLTRWHREAGEWNTADAGHKARLVHWMVTTGRPVIGTDRWDALATELMGTISDGQIQGALRSMIDTRDAAAIAVVRGEPTIATDKSSARIVAGVVDDASAAPLDPIDPDWMTRLAGPLVDANNRHAATVREISQHPASGVWSAELQEGVRVHARSVDDASGEVHLSATVWGDGLADGSLSEDQIAAALTAWEQPACESRPGRALAVYIDEHGLDVDVRRLVRGVQLSIEAPASKQREATEMLFVLLDEPMIEAEAFDRRERTGGIRGSIDELDRALTLLFTPDRIPSPAAERTLSVDDAQRALTQIVRNGRIDIGIAAPADAAETIEQASEVLGGLSGRVPATAPASGPSSSPVLGERAVRVPDKHSGVAIGIVGADGAELARLRAGVLGSMILGQRLDAGARAAGLDDSVWAQIIQADALGERWALLLRARCDASDTEAYNRLLEDTLAALDTRPVSQEELAVTQSRLDESVARYFDTPGFWSMRLSTLGINGRTIDQLWTIRDGYASITPAQVNAVLSQTNAAGQRFRIEFTEPEHED